MKNNIYAYYFNNNDSIIAAGILYNYYKYNTGLFKNSTDVEEKFKFNMISYNDDLSFNHIDFSKGDQVYFLGYNFNDNHNRKEFENLLHERKSINNIIWIDNQSSYTETLDEYDISGIRDAQLCISAWTYLYFNLHYKALKEEFEEVTWNLLIKDISYKFHHNNGISLFLKYIDDQQCQKNLYEESNDFCCRLNINDPRDPKILNLL